MGRDSFSASRARVSRSLGLCEAKPGACESRSGSLQSRSGCVRAGVGRVTTGIRVCADKLKVRARWGQDACKSAIFPYKYGVLVETPVFLVARATRPTGSAVWWGEATDEPARGDARPTFIFPPMLRSAPPLPPANHPRPCRPNQLKYRAARRLCWDRRCRGSPVRP